MHKILIVDDSAFMRNILKDLLTTKNDNAQLVSEVEIYEADGKINALEQVKKIKPDVILLDVVMQNSEIEGLEFLNEVKNFFDTKKIIMISSVGQAFMNEETDRIGVADYIQKPFEQEQVITAVNKLLS